MSKAVHRTSLRYRVLSFLLGPAAFGHVVYRSFKDGGRRYFLQRLGLSYPLAKTPSILVHCASVGELSAARPLLSELCRRLPDHQLVISTNTPTAARLASGLSHQGVMHVYMPLDYPFAVSKLLSRIHPSSVLILETEIWPTLLFQTAKKRIATAIINGRLSSRTLRVHRLLRNEYRSSLRNLAAILARSEEDRLKFLELGAESRTTHTVGNLKYAAARTGMRPQPTAIRRPFVLAASTHEGEELQLVHHLPLLKQNNFLLVIAPRYPARGKQLCHQLQQKNLHVDMRSRQDRVSDRTDVYIVDTLGELDSYLNEAVLVFMGGSLIPRGGHNILEPAGFGKCTIVGPHMDNFSLETRELMQAGGIIQVSDNLDLGVQLARLVNDNRTRDHYGANAQQFIQQNSPVLGHYMKHLQPLLKLH